MPALSSASAYSNTPMSYDRFRPKFPVDPFADVDQVRNNTPSAREPWTLDLDALPLPSILQHERRVILVIGQATSAALDPLFASPHLTSSLLVIANHRPPALPFDTYPSVYTLRLRTPLAIADAGSTRLVDILEWALQVARLWRRSGGPKKQELMEEVTPASDSVPLGQSFGRIRYSVVPESIQDSKSSSGFSPSMSVTSLAPSTATKARRQSFFRRKSALPLVPDSASAKPFDALIHFLPVDGTDKARLKAAILVTTLTRPYLAVPPTRTSSMRLYSESTTKLSLKSGKRWSFLRGGASLTSPADSSTTTLSAPRETISTTDLRENSSPRHSPLTTLALLRACRSRLVHVMPSAPGPIKPSGSGSRLPATNSNTALAHLIRSTETFLLSFCFSISPDFPAPIAGFASGDADIAKARPYVLPVSALAEVLRLQSDGEDDEPRDTNEDDDTKKHSNEWTLAELVLSGALESETESIRSTPNLRCGKTARIDTGENEKGKEKLRERVNEAEWMSRRAWISGVRDIIVVRSTSLKPAEKAHTVPSRSSPQPLLPSQAYSWPCSPSSQPTVRPQPVPQYQDPVLRPKPAQLQTSQPQDIARSVNNNEKPSSIHNSKSALYVETRRKGRGKFGYQSLALEKRLPTPPEDENEELEDQDVDECDSMVSNATSGTRSPHPDDAHEDSRMSGKSEVQRGGPEPSSTTLKQRCDPPWRDLPQAGKPDSCPGERQRRRSFSQTPPTPSFPTAVSDIPVSSHTRSSTSAPVSSSSSRRLPGQHRYEPARSSSRRHEVSRTEDDYEVDKQRLGNTSLPTPPASEEASSEDVTDSLPFASSSSSPSTERGIPATGAASSSRDRRPSQNGRRRGASRDADADVTGNARRKEETERNSKRERRQRSNSQPSNPSVITAALSVRISPRRSKTSSKEHSGKDRSRTATLERHASGARTKVDKPVPPEIKRKPRSGERRAKLEKKSSRPEMKRSQSEGTQHSERRTARRVPVPRLEDVLPPLPRPPPPQRPPPPPPGAFPSPHSDNHLEAFRISQEYKSTPELLPMSEKARLSSTKHRVKWKFWRAEKSAVVSV